MPGEEQVNVLLVKISYLYLTFVACGVGMYQYNLRPPYSSVLVFRVFKATKNCLVDFLTKSLREANHLETSECKYLYVNSVIGTVIILSTRSILLTMYV